MPDTKSATIFLRYFNRISASEDIAEILNAVCEAIVELTDIESAIVVSSEDNQIIFTYPNSIDSIFHDFNSLLSSDDTLKESVSILSHTPLSIMLAFPNSRVIIFLEASGNTDFNQDQVEFLHEIHQYTVISIEKIGRIKQAGQFAKIVEQAANQVNAIRAALHRYDSETKRLVFVASYNRGAGPLININDGLSGYLVRMNMPYIIEDDYNDSQWSHPVYKGNRPFPSVLKILLQWKNETVGVLSLDDKEGRKFSKNDVLHLKDLTRNIASQLNKSDLAKRLYQINNLTSDIATIAATGDLPKTLEQIANGVHEILECASVALYIYDIESLKFNYVATSGVNSLNVENVQTPVPPNSIFFKLTPNSQTYIISDIKDDPYSSNRKFIKTELVKAYIGIPLNLKVKGTTRGILFVNYQTPHHFSQDELNTVQLFANQASVTVENEQLQHELQRTNQSLNKLYSASKEINSNLDIVQTIQRIADEALNLTQRNSQNNCFSHITILDKNNLRYMASSPRHVFGDLNKNIIKVDNKGPIGIIGRVAKSGLTENVHPVVDDGDYVMLRPDIQSQLTVPIKLEERTVGVLAIEHARLDPFSKDDIKNIESLAALAATAIGRAKVLDRLNSLREISFDLTLDLEKEELFEKMLERASILLDGTSAGLRDYDREQGNLPLISRYNRGTLDRTLKVGEGYAGRLVMDNAPAYIMIDDYNKWIREIGEYDTLKGLQNGAVLAVPVNWNSNPVAVLFVSDHLDRKFTLDDVSKLRIIGDQFATALMYFRLVERLKKVQVLSNAVGKITIGLSINDVLQNIVDIAKDIIRCDIVVLYMVNSNTRLLVHPAFHTEVRFPKKMKQDGEINEDSRIYNILEQKKPFIVDNPSKAIFPKENEPGRFGKGFIDDECIQSYAAIPLYAGDNALGIMFAHYRREHIFIDGLDDLNFFADQASIAIQNSRNLELLRQNNQVLRTLAQVNTQITRADQLPELFEEIIEGAASLIPSEHRGEVTGVFHQIVRDSDEEYIIDEKSLAYPVDGTFAPSRLHEKTGVTWLVVNSKKTRLFENIGPKNSIVHPKLYPNGIRSMIAMPLKIEDEIMGVLFLNDTKPNSFGKIKRPLEQLADHAAIAIHKVREYKRLETLDIRNKQFIRLAAHELRKPLSTIMAATENLYNSGTLTPEQSKRIGKIERSSQYLNFIADNTFHSEKIRENRIDIDLKSTEFIQIVTDVIGMIKDSDEYANPQMNIVVELPPDGVFIVNIDGLAMTHVMMNLIHNAVKFNRKNGTITITLNELVCTEELEVIVKDTGIGMSLKEIQHIFDWSYQVNSTSKRNYDGMGVGLFIVKEYLKQHSIDIEVSSCLEKGSEFSFKMALLS